MNISSSEKERVSYLFLALSMLFVAALIVSNTIATKIIMVGGLAVAAGIICFPITYILSDIVTEVYGYQRAKFVTWVGFGCLAIMSLMYTLATWLPPAPFYQSEAAFDALFSLVPRIAVGSLFGFLVGTLLNAVVLSKLKILTAGRHLWIRTIGSTLVGEAADSFVFALIAFAGVLAFDQLLLVGFTGFLFKTLYEIAATPITYWAVRKVKAYEGIDTFDHDVRYSLVP